MQRDDARRCSRRGLLRAGGAVALGTTTAGCIATLPPLGRRVRFGRVDAPDAGPPTDRRWLPDPAAFRNGDDDHWTADVVAPIAFTPGNLGEDVVGERFSMFAGYVLGNVDYAGVDLADVDRLFKFGPAFVTVADVDRETARTTLAGTGYERAGTHRGWDVYGRADLGRALAVGDDGVVVVPRQTGLDDPLSAGLDDARTVVDAAAGAAPRFHETSDRYRLLSDAVGRSPLTWHTGGAEGGRVAGAVSYRYDDAAVYFVWHWLYPEGDAPTEAAVKRTVEEDYLETDAKPRDAEDVDVTVDGRIATIEIRHTHGWFREHNREQALPPLTTWGVDHDADAGTLTVRLESGDPVPADHLSIDYHPAGPAATPETQFTGSYDTVTPGDAVTVDVSDRPVETPTESEPLDADLRVTWSDGPGNTVLVEYPFP